MRQRIGKFTVIGKQQKPFGITVKPSDRIYPLRHIGNQLSNTFAFHFVAHGGNKSARLMKHNVLMLLLLDNFLSADGNGVLLRVDFIA